MWYFSVLASPWDLFRHVILLCRLWTREKSCTPDRLDGIKCAVLDNSVGDITVTQFMVRPPFEIHAPIIIWWRHSHAVRGQPFSTRHALLVVCWHHCFSNPVQSHAPLVNDPIWWRHCFFQSHAVLKQPSLWSSLLFQSLAIPCTHYRWPNLVTSCFFNPMHP